MSTNPWIFWPVAVAATLLSVAITAFLKNEPYKQTDISFERPDVGVLVQLDGVKTAVTPHQRARGLMHLDADVVEPMLFVFNEELPHSFWMKNVRVPLDMIFANRDGLIVDVFTNVPAHSTMRHVPRESALYVLETPAGFAQRYNVSIGDQLLFKGAPKF